MGLLKCKNIISKRLKRRCLINKPQNPYNTIKNTVAKSINAKAILTLLKSLKLLVVLNVTDKYDV